MASSGHSYTINGVKVQFPHKPYPSQLSMMDKIIKGLNRKQNCLLESPTGSGKSLALLCSALAWQQTELEKARSENKEFMDKVGSVSGCTCNCGEVQKSDATEQQLPVMTAANQVPPLAVNQPVPSAVSVDDDNDFQPDMKRFKTPSAGGQDGDSGTSGESVPSWTMAVNRPTESAAECCSCAATAAEKPNRKIPKIYFGTRTHKQVAQITRELGKTAYSGVRMTILSSREHSCIHPQVSKMSGKNEECKNLLDGPGCRFFDNVRRKVSHASLRLSGLNSGWDLEDFKGFCRNAKACSYFGGRQLKTDADIVFCPYNYLVDPGIRETMEIYLKDQIVILDEAHNIEDASREAASRSVSQKELTDAVEDLNRMIEQAVKVADHRNIRDMMTGLYELIERNRQTTVSDGFNSAYKMWTGFEMVAQMKNCGIGPEKFDALRKSFTSISEVEDVEQQRRKGPEVKLKSATLKTAGALFTVLDFIYRDNLKHMDDYRVALLKSMVYVNVPTEGRWLNKHRRPRQMDWTFSLNFWCLNPAVAFSDFGETCRSIILTSGTLSPMQSFQSELGVPFPIQLEASHVIGKSQVWVGCISKGPRGTALLGNYQNSETFAYQDDVGALVYEVCSTVPHGVLCFVSSYKAIDKLMDRWKSTGLYERLQEHKVIMVEPKASDKVDFDEVIQNFYQVIEEHEEAEGGGVTGAFFMAVCRGKVSEGLDFADNNARAVITVGIPFPNVKDPQVDLKKQYNNQHSASRGLLKGSDWYEIQAYRALNQALGRCIRHRNDWGALILVDERFGKNPQKYTKGLSKWVRQKVQQFYAFSAAKSSLARFTRERLENPTTADVSVLNMTSMLQSPARVNQPTEPQFTASFLPMTSSDPPVAQPATETIAANLTEHPVNQQFVNGQTVFLTNQGTQIVSTNQIEYLTNQQQVLVVENGATHLTNQRESTVTNAFTNINDIARTEVYIITENQPVAGLDSGQAQQVLQNVILPTAIENGGFLMPHNPVSTEIHGEENPSNQNLTITPMKMTDTSVLQTQGDVASKTVICGDGQVTPGEDLEGYINLTEEEFEFNPRMASTQICKKSQGLRLNRQEKSQTRGSFVNSSRKSDVIGTPVSTEKENMDQNLEGKHGMPKIHNGRGNLSFGSTQVNKALFGQSQQQHSTKSVGSSEEMKTVNCLQSDRKSLLHGHNVPPKHQWQSNKEMVKSFETNHAVGTEGLEPEFGQDLNSEVKANVEKIAPGRSLLKKNVKLAVKKLTEPHGGDTELSSKVVKSGTRSASPDMFDSGEEANMSCDHELEEVVRSVHNEMIIIGEQTSPLKITKPLFKDFKQSTEYTGDQSSSMCGSEVKDHLIKKTDMFQGDEKVVGERSMTGRRSLSLGRTKNSANVKTGANEQLKGKVGSNLEETCSMDNSRSHLKSVTSHIDSVHSNMEVSDPLDKVQENEESIKKEDAQVGGASETPVNQGSVGGATAAANQDVVEGPLVTRRGTRVKKRRCLGEAGGGNISKKLKRKGVDFLNDLERVNAESYHRVTCKACGKEICPKVKEYSEASSLPSYVKKVCKDSPVWLVKATDVLEPPPKSTHLELKMNDGMYINSYWSETDACCYKYLFCRCSAKTIGLEVKCMVGDDKSPTMLQVGQVWIFKDFAELCAVATDP